MFSRARYPQSPSEAKKKELLSELFPGAVWSAVDPRNRKNTSEIVNFMMRKSSQLLLMIEIGPVEVCGMKISNLNQ